jgi:hypothetical protein
MKPKCKHPDITMIRRQAKLAAGALIELANLGVEILSVNFDAPQPVIQVSYCRGCDSIHHAGTGRGRSNDGTVYVKRVAHMSGCQVEWNMEQPA